VPLSDAAIRDAKPAAKPRKLTDERGLYLLLNPNGSRWWRFRYRVGTKEKLLSLGTYPDTDLLEARARRDAARKLLADGLDPAEQRKAAKTGGEDSTANDSERLARAVRETIANMARPLGALGIDDMEERVYRVLLAHRMATTEDVATILSQSAQEVQRLLDSIESKGLASHSPERPRRYIASPPELAVEALASQRHAEIERARSTIPQLKEQAANADALGNEQLVELITSREALVQILIHLRQTVQNEIVCFQRAPLLFTQHQHTVPKIVHTRSISDTGYLACPGALNSLRLDVGKGEEARIFPALPIKMVIADRRIGIIPLNTGDQGGSTMLVRSSSLLDALYALFELTWERATPVQFSRTDELEIDASPARLSDAAEQVMSLLAAGLNDKAIAHETGISTATLTRRINELMKSFDTRTRFQLGWRAALEAYPERVSASAPLPVA